MHASHLWVHIKDVRRSSDSSRNFNYRWERFLPIEERLYK